MYNLLGDLAVYYLWSITNHLGFDFVSDGYSGKMMKGRADGESDQHQPGKACILLPGVPD